MNIVTFQLFSDVRGGEEEEEIIRQPEREEGGWRVGGVISSAGNAAGDFSPFFPSFQPALKKKKKNHVSYSSAAADMNLPCA